MINRKLTDSQKFFNLVSSDLFSRFPLRVIILILHINISITINIILNIIIITLIIMFMFMIIMFNLVSSDIACSSSLGFHCLSRRCSCLSWTTMITIQIFMATMIILMIRIGKLLYLIIISIKSEANLLQQP